MKNKKDANFDLTFDNIRQSEVFKPVEDGPPKVSILTNGFNILDEVKDSYIPRVDTLQFHKEIERNPHKPNAKQQELQMISFQKQMENEKIILERKIREKSIALKN